MQEDSRTGPTLLGLVATSVVAVACATAASPVDELAAGSASLDAARSAGATEFAPGEMSAANAKLQKAREAAREGRHVQARRLAEEADVDAQAALARAAAQRWRGSLSATQAALQEEIRRLDGATAQPVR